MEWIQAFGVIYAIFFLGGQITCSLEVEATSILS